LEIRNKIATELQALCNQQQQQNSSTNTKTRYIRFADGEQKRLSFMDFEKKPVKNKDFDRRTYTRQLHIQILLLLS
jgi:hypothetical protein